MTERAPLFAWTAPTGSYPAYLNVRRDGDEIVVTLRSEAEDNGDHLVCGQTVSMRMPADQGLELGWAALQIAGGRP